MSFFKLLLAFAPWIAFLIIAHGSLLRLKLGLVIAFALCVVMGVTRLRRGVILWAGLCFFTFATIAVVMFENMWRLRTGEHRPHPVESAGVSQDEFHHHFDVDLELHRERHPGLGEDGRVSAAGIGI